MFHRHIKAADDGAIDVSSEEAKEQNAQSGPKNITMGSKSWGVLSIRCLSQEFMHKYNNTQCQKVGWPKKCPMIKVLIATWHQTAE